MSNPIAVVVGLCAHGLSISRSLNRAGIKVVAIEANRQLPGTTTNSADIVYVNDINGASLIDALITLSPSISASGIPVLFLTNDTMVATVGKHYERLAHLYNLSWGPTRHAILPLLRKEEIEKRCQRTGLRYPKTKMIRDGLDAATANLNLTFPIIFKPNRPISSYKTLVVEDQNQLERSLPTIETALPSIAQEFIPGDDTKIQFAALYLTRGEVAARFEGRKLRSRPMGHTSIAIGETNDEIHDLARNFFDGLQLTGPVSLEAKLGPDFGFWIIEPTVGRTDFWVGLCAADGVNLPLLEYRHQCGQNLKSKSQRNRTLWINGERQPSALGWILSAYPRYVFKMKIVGVFLDFSDFRPLVRWVSISVYSLPKRLADKIKKTLRRIF